LSLPAYVGPCALGIKMGIILPGCDLPALILESLQSLERDGLLASRDVLCITESVLARAQNNFVTTAEVADEVKKKMSLSPNGKIGIVFPIASRNRFNLVLEGIAAAVPQGEVILQLSYPCDEVGNQFIPPETATELVSQKKDLITLQDLEKGYAHPITGVDYLKLYYETIANTGAQPTIFLCNDPLKIFEYRPDAVLAADIHSRETTRQKLTAGAARVFTLQDLFSDRHYRAWSEWGLLGSNMSAGDMIKLAPREAEKFVNDLQGLVSAELGKDIEVIVNGDGAYKDPCSGIYELADPLSAFGATSGVDSLRQGFKYKYLIDLYHQEGKSKEEIEALLVEEAALEREPDSMELGGTTPRRMGDVLASLADLVSGSADAGTPLVLIKGIVS
jgi:hypothetical protein